MNIRRYCRKSAAPSVFRGGRIEIVLTEQPKSGVVFVFAYDEGNNFLGILKPVTEKKAILRRGDLADVKAPVRGQEVGKPIFLKRMDRYAEKTDSFEKVVQARDRGGHYGVQRCLHPVCTKCVDACKTVISSGDLAIVMRVQKGGSILPEFSKGKCPRCGRCFTDCPTGSIERSPGRQH